METKFFASIRSKAGRILFASQAHASREDAARECFAARPKAHEASTSRAGFINGEYRDCGSDIQWILRRNVMTAQVSELTEIYPTTEAAQIAMRQWIALHKETA